jgi:hypothetical protein
MIQLHTLYSTHNLDIHPPLKLPLRSLPTPLALVAPSRQGTPWSQVQCQQCHDHSHMSVAAHLDSTLASGKWTYTRAFGTCYISVEDNISGRTQPCS